MTAAKRQPCRNPFTDIMLLLHRFRFPTPFKGTIEFGRLRHDPGAVNVPVHDVVDGTNKRSSKDRKKEEEDDAIQAVESVDDWEPTKPLF